MADACPDYERALTNHRPVVGVDEVGRGPLAGPVVAAAAYLPDVAMIRGLRDSKALTEKRRLVLTDTILKAAHVAYGGVSAALIDRWGIEKATQTAMMRAVQALTAAPTNAVVLVDGNRAPTFGSRDAITEVKADGSCPSVAAAAIVAKTLRDRAMVRLDSRYTHYHWRSNKGYGSAAHREAILVSGVSAHHRRSFLSKLLKERTA